MKFKLVSRYDDNYYDYFCINNLEILISRISTSSIDNIDHNQSSNTAKTFHDNLITILRHTDMTIEKQKFSFAFKVESDNSNPSNCPLLTH